MAERPDRPTPPRCRRLIAGIGLGAVALVALGSVAVGVILWRASDLLIKPVVSQPMNTAVVAASESTVVLPSTVAATSEGVFGLEWECGEHVCAGRVGKVLETDDDTVTRVFESTSVPEVDSPARLLVTVFSGDPSSALDLPYEDVFYRSDLGDMPAWLVPASGSTWVIQVHGLGAGRAAGLRTMPALHGAGFPVLDIAFRNDPDAPSDANGGRQLGRAEWQDLDAAVRYAVGRGATDVVLFGFSMGGAIVTQYMSHADDTSRVRGVVLDSPVLDYRAALAHVVRGLGLPSGVVGIEQWVIESRTGVRFTEVDALALSDDSARRPARTLIFHGASDSIVPVASSRAYAQRWPGAVDLVVVKDAIHTGAWNVDPESYEARLLSFLRALP